VDTTTTNNNNNNEQPTTNNQQPTTNNQQPTTNNNNKSPTKQLSRHALAIQYSPTSTTSGFYVTTSLNLFITKIWLYIF